MARKKHFWTPAQDQLLLRYYDGHREHLKRLYRMLPYPAWAVRHRARDFGLTRKKEPRWTPRDEAFLQAQIGTMPWPRLAKHLGRTCAR